MIKREVGETLKLAAPVVLAQVAQMSMSFVDAVMVGRLGAGQLAAAALGGSVFYPVTIVCLGVLSAVGPMVAQGFGAGDSKEVGRSVRQGLWLAAMLCVPAVLLLAKAGPFLAAIGLDRATTELAQSYLRALGWGVPALFGFAVLRNFMEGLARPRVVTGLTLLGVVLNIAGNYTLMYGKLGFPALGLRGCGLASAFVCWSMALGLVLFIVRRRDLSAFQPFSRLSKPDRHRFRELFRIGWPIGVSQGLEAGIFAATAFLMGLLGVQVLAAHQIALQCAALTFMVPLGVSIAASVRVGQAVGRGDPAGAARAGYCGIGLGALFMSMAALAFLTMPHPIISLFMDLDRTENSFVVAMAVRLLAAAALFQIFDGMQVTAMGALRGLKDTRFPMLIALFSYWGIGMATGWTLAFPAGLGGVGLWFGLAAGLAVAALLLSLRFHRSVGRRIAEKDGRVGQKTNLF